MTTDFFDKDYTQLKKMIERTNVSYTMTGNPDSRTSVNCYYMDTKKARIATYSFVDKKHIIPIKYLLRITPKTGENKNKTFDFKDDIAKSVFLNMLDKYNEQVKKTGQGIVFNKYSFESRTR